MALNFVASEDGLEEDSKLQGLARLLKVSIPLAYWFVMRWRRFVLNYGDCLRGNVPKKYSANDLAAFLKFEGAAARLVLAMKAQGFVGSRKGKGFHYPDWEKTVTGAYARRREEDNDWHRKDRKERRKAHSLKSDSLQMVGGASADASADGLHDIGTRSDSNKGRKDSGGPPRSPPSGGASIAEIRWNWLLERAPTPSNRSACIKILELMSEGEWGLCQGAFSYLDAGAPILSVRKKRVLAWPLDNFLRKQAYYQFRVKPAVLHNRVNGVLNGGKKEATKDEDDKAERDRSADLFLNAWLTDPAVPERKKEHARREWMQNPVNVGRSPPWMTSTGGGQ